MDGDWHDEVVFEGGEADAFVEALEHGPASADYLREADETFARLYCAEPFNRLFDTAATRRRDGRREPTTNGLLSFEEMLRRARETRERSTSGTTAAAEIRADGIGSGGVALE